MDSEPARRRRGRPPHPDILTPEWQALALLAKVAPAAAALAAVAVLVGLGCGSGTTNQAQINSAPLSASPCITRPDDQPVGTPQLFVPRHIESKIWTVDPQGRFEQAIILGSSPLWSPDGRWLAFRDGTFDGLHSRGSLCAVTADAKRIVQFGPMFSGDVAPACRGQGKFAWSGDSHTLVYEGLDDVMFTVSSDFGSTSDQPLTHGLGPAWAPNGSKIAFTWLTEIGLEAYCGVWLVYVNDRDKHDLLFAPGESPAFSPDGNRVAFVDGGRLMIGSSSGGQAETIVDVAPGESRYRPGPHQITWSPDGTKLGYVYDSPGDGWARLYSVEAHPGAKPVDFGEGSNPSWSPDGERIVFSRSEGDGQCTIYTASADGQGKPSRLTSGCDPDWSPDGTRIAFTR